MSNQITTSQTATAQHGLDRFTVEQLRAAHDALESVWEGIASGALSINELHHCSRPLFAVYFLGFDAGIAAQAERVRQAEHDTDRAWLRTLNDSDRAEEIERRLNRQLEAIPADITPHGPEYFAAALSGVFRQVAA
ncbi:MAG: hypothetical protein ACQEWM_06005 [Actinomycetota bacterium]